METAPPQATQNSKFVLETYRDEFFRAQRSKLENRTCFDCNARNTTWLSASYAIYLCLNCSSHHRRLGTHISFVRSCDLDQFTPEQLRRIEIGGNSRARTFFKTHGLSDGRHVDYNGKAASKYRQMLDRELKALNDKASQTAVTAGTNAAPVQNDVSAETTGSTVEKDSSSEDLSKKINVQNANVPVQRSAGVTTGAVPARLAMSSAAATPGMGTGAAVQARKLDIDFDFEQAVMDDEFAQSLPLPVAATLASSNTPSAVRTPLQSINASTKIVNTTGATTVASASATRFSGDKGISSERFFANESAAWNGANTTQREHAGRLAQFESSRAISSSAYFGNEQTNSVNATAGDEQIGQLTDTAREGLSNISRGAQVAYSSAKSWFNQFGV